MVTGRILSELVLVAGRMLSELVMVAGGMFSELVLVTGLRRKKSCRYTSVIKVRNSAVNLLPTSPIRIADSHVM